MLTSHILIFEDVLGTNYTPTDNEVITIKNLISEPLLRVAELDEEISAAEKRLHDLRQSRVDMLAGIEPYRQLISPARRLPTDLIREIFVNCLPEDRNPTMSADEAPVLLTRISSHWRIIAFTTPRLWAALHIAVPNSHSGFTGWHNSQGNRIPVSQIIDVRLAATTEWIKKSGTLPLSFSLRENGFGATDYSKVFIQHILPYRARWKSINLFCDPSAFLDIYDLPASEVPLLQSMSFVVVRAERARLQMRRHDMSIFRAPEIRRITMSGMSAEISKLPLTWSKLTDLDIKGNSWDGSPFASLGDIISTLTRCPNLISLSLRTASRNNAWQQEQVTQFPTISLPRLESLSIFDEEDFSALYKSIDAPKVRKLTFNAFRGIVEQPDSTTCPLHALLESIGSSLEELVLVPDALQGQEEALACLALCTSLISLSITKSLGVWGPVSEDRNDPPSFGNGLLEALAHIFNGDPYICPKLAVLKCSSSALFTDEALVQFILRKQGGEDRGLSPLKSVDVTFMRRPTIDVPALFSQYTAAGLDLKLQYPPRAFRGLLSLYHGIPFSSEAGPYVQGG